MTSFICGPCGVGVHNKHCKGLIKGRTWCDCQHQTKESK